MCNEINCGAKYHTLVHKSLQWLLYTVNWLMEIFMCYIVFFLGYTVHTISDCPDFSVLSKAYHFSSTDQNGTYKQIQLDSQFHIAVSTF